ncbi:MAG: hypothetical protein QG611_1048 [Bacteroidota bacterium]|nr:hypothetical protein [Bacteroidota bacterium]
MKKLLFIPVFMMTALVVNAQRVAVPLSSEKESNLTNVITDNVTKEHSGFTIKEATWDWSTTLVPGNIFVYEVVITNGKVDEVLYYDKDGKFLMKGAAREAVPEKKEAESAVPDQNKVKK